MSDGCGHAQCAADPVEQHVRDAAAAALGDADLRRVCERVSDSPKPDFSSERHALEVKQLTSPALREFDHAMDAHLPQRHYPIDALQHTWGVILDVSPAAGSFEPTRTPKAATLLAALTPLLAQLEARDARDALTDQLIWPSVVRLIGRGGSCSVIPPGPFPPGIVYVGRGNSHSRTMNLEYDVAGFVQYWLDSDHSRKARQSLAHEPQQRVLGLAARPDGPATAMAQTLTQSPGVEISTPLRLPTEIDIIVIATNDEVVVYTAATGWSRHASG